MEKAYSVHEINLFIQKVLDKQPALKDITVIGEIGQYQLRNGHLFITLREEVNGKTAVLSGIFFRYQQRLSGFYPEDFSVGDLVRVRGSITTYFYGSESRYQLHITAILPAGEGKIALWLRRVEKRLKAKGYFDRKRPIPSFPKAIAVLTSLQGQALHDIIQAFKQHNPAITLYFFPVLVQGDKAAESILVQLQRAQRYHSDIEAIVIARGGGASQDLWCFNNEALAEAIYHSVVPVITAIGHTKDQTIADKVADKSVRTPTAVVECFVKLETLLQILQHHKQTLNRLLRHQLESQQKRLEWIRYKLYNLLQNQIKSRKTPLQHYKNLLKNQITQRILTQKERLQHYRQRLQKGWKRYLETQRRNLQFYKTQLRLLDYQSVLQRGFAFVEQNKRWVRSKKQLQKGHLKIHWHDGSIQLGYK